MKKAIKIIFLCVFVLVALTIGAAAFRSLDFTNPISMSLNGEQIVLLEYGQAYQDPGATAKIPAEGISVPVTVSGEVDESRLGKYLLKYTAQSGDRTCTEYRHVYIVDTEAPIITLTSNPDAYTLVGETYREEGFVATDNHDGDLTRKVIRKERDGIITYTVTDSSGNTTMVTRTINYIDLDAPIISLIGGQISFIMAGENYAEPGCTATDFRDGDLSDDVIVSGDVDGNLPGIYTLKYSITNSIGVESVKERIIYVIPRQKEEKPGTDETLPEETLPKENITTPGTTIIPNGRTIYLTFDDGPTRLTGKLLDILKKYNVKATFFVINSSYMQYVTRAAEEGHTIAIHTNSHNYSKIYASDEAFINDMEAIQNTILQYTGQKTMLTRFPGGSSNTISSAYNKGIMTRLVQRLEASGYTYFDWNVDSNDAGGARTAEEVFNNVIEGIGNKQNSVVLQHDTQNFSIDAVERIIAWGLCNGYTFAALTADSPTCHHGVRN